MLIKMVRNDFKKNPGNNLVLLLFMTLSVGLIATVILTISQLFMSISTMYETAKPPHFLQMHKGKLDQEESKDVKKEFTVSSYIYDGQMNSTLYSSTRFLISDADFYNLHGIVGETEYLLETYFQEPSMAVDYQTAYEEYMPSLPKNGQAVTYTIIFLLSAMTDIMTAMIVLVMSVLLTFIALFCMKYTILTAMEEEGNKKGIYVDSGEQAGVGLQYLMGNAPSNGNEIALSKLESESLDKNLGDTLSLRLENKEIVLKVCGIYQDVTSGGMTAKITRVLEGVIPEQYTFMVDILQQSKKQELVESWGNQLGNGYAVEQMDEFISEILGGVVHQMKSAAGVAMAIGIGLTGLVISLFMKLRLASTASQIAIQKALGIPAKKVRRQELYEVLISASIGIICGKLFWRYPYEYSFFCHGVGNC
jgi:hypothetical protein